MNNLPLDAKKTTTNQLFPVSRLSNRLIIMQYHIDKPVHTYLRVLRTFVAAKMIKKTEGTVLRKESVHEIAILHA